MKKTLRLSLLSLLVLIGSNLMAQNTVTIDFDADYQSLFPTLAGVSSNESHDGDFTEPTASTAVQGVSVVVAPDADAKTPSRIWSSAPRLRMYSGTFTVKGSDITKIEFTGHNTNFNLSTTTGTLSDKTWTGKADEVVFAVAKNTQINKIVVTLGESGDVEPSDPTPDPELSTCADVIAGADGTTFRVRGVCTSIANTNYGNWYLKDETGEVYIYGTVDADGKYNWASFGIEVGDTVTVEGQKKTYKQVSELVDVTVLSVAKKQGDDTPQEINILTTAEALAIIAALDNGKTTAEEYYVKGIVVTIDEISVNYGNATFDISDSGAPGEQLKVYRAKGFDGAPIASEDIISVGDEVVVHGKLQKFVKNDVVTPEVATGGSLYSVNGVSTGIQAIARSQSAGALFTLGGQRVVKASKGIYIQNGRKVVLK